MRFALVMIARSIIRPLKPLTVLLPLKDRVSFTKRWLAYAEAVNLPARVLIADGGSDDAVAPMAADSRARGLDVEYVRYPFDATYQDYYAKLADALARVTTPFVVLADNDDMFVPEGLNGAVDFLLAHPDYVACGGQWAVFWLAGADRRENPLYGDAVEFKSSNWISTDVTNTARQRVRERCLGANDLFYAVHRTEVLRNDFEAIRDCNPRDLFFVEPLIMFLTVIAGKTHQLDRLYIARQQDSPGSAGGAHQAQYGDWYDRMLVPTWSEDFTRFVDCTAAAMARADGIPEDEARRVVIEAHKLSVAPALLADLLEEPSVSFSMPLVQQVVRRLVNLPRTSLVRRLALKMYRRSQWLSHQFVYGIEWRSGPPRKSAHEFTQIREFLTRSSGQSL
jgi:glycosyltransferase domain-containing protein